MGRGQGGAGRHVGDYAGSASPSPRAARRSPSTRCASSLTAPPDAWATPSPRPRGTGGLSCADLRAGAPARAPWWRSKMSGPRGERDAVLRRAAEDDVLIMRRRWRYRHLAHRRAEDEEDGRGLTLELVPRRRPAGGARGARRPAASWSASRRAERSSSTRVKSWPQGTGRHRANDVTARDRASSRWTTGHMLRSWGVSSTRAGRRRRSPRPARLCSAAGAAGPRRVVEAAPRAARSRRGAAPLLPLELGGCNVRGRRPVG